MTSRDDLFRRTAYALFGTDNSARMADYLTVEKSTVRKWASGASRVPPGVWRELAKLAAERETALSSLGRELAEAADP